MWLVEGGSLQMSSCLMLFKAEKEKGESLLSAFVKNLRERTQLMRDSLVEKR